MAVDAPARGGVPLTPRGQATRERIVVAAATLMHQRGVAGTSLEDVCVATGTSKSQLYHYFRDKSALVGAVIERQVEWVLSAQEPELSAIDSAPSLRRWRDRVVALGDPVDSVGCPLGRLASELAGSDAAARVALAKGFAQWQHRLAVALGRMPLGRMHSGSENDERPYRDPEAVAAGLLAALQGGLLLARTTGSVAPLEAALDVAIAGVQARANES